MAAKLGIFFYLIESQEFSVETSFIGSVNMLQISEFGLILGAQGLASGLIGQEVVSLLSLTAIITMGASSYLLRYNRQIYNRIDHVLARFESEKVRDVDISSREDHAVIIGFDKTFNHLIEVIEENFEEIVVVDEDPSKVRQLSDKDVDYIYGDFEHQEIREEAGLQSASLVLSGVENRRANILAARESREDAALILYSKDDEVAVELYDEGADYVIKENLLMADYLENMLELFLEDRPEFNEEMKTVENRLRWITSD